jgi:hypothetical protein
MPGPEVIIPTGGKRDSTQTILAQEGGAKEGKTILKNAWSLFWSRVILLGWLLIVLPVLAGRLYLVVVVFVVAMRLAKPLIWLERTGVAMLAAAIAFWAVDHSWVPWYPVSWGWGGGRMPLTIGTWTVNLADWFIWPRLFLALAPPFAVEGSFRFAAWRWMIELINPAASSVPINAGLASSVQTPRGAPIRYIDPGSDDDEDDGEDGGPAYMRVRGINHNGNGQVSGKPEAPMWAAGKVFGHRTEGLAHIPLDLVRSPGEDAETAVARFGLIADALMDGGQLSEPYLAREKAILTGAQWRRLIRWLRDRGYAEKVGPKRNDEHRLTERGESLMEQILDTIEEPELE